MFCQNNNNNLIPTVDMHYALTITFKWNKRKIETVLYNEYFMLSQRGEQVI